MGLVWLRLRVLPLGCGDGNDMKYVRLCDGQVRPALRGRPWWYFDRGIGKFWGIDPDGRRQPWQWRWEKSEWGAMLCDSVTRAWSGLLGELHCRSWGGGAFSRMGGGDEEGARGNVGTSCVDKKKKNIASKESQASYRGNPVSVWPLQGWGNCAVRSNDCSFSSEGKELASACKETWLGTKARSCKGANYLSTIKDKTPEMKTTNWNL